ncbi:MAG: ATP synthase F1 subunit gamma [Firmicutes bacterium]|nr:ATP synthase F1 subunit gamma [Bacillota bacterium]MCM1400639.1 ATP synthase F1 subunit gamma [Bacteroides sp.]MCM1476330.1 ATP synthase F1 subunit gamma [Bacteroides sp.]
MATLRELKGRIGSVASSEKITGAMKMISSAKMHKAEMALRRLLPYRRQIETIIGNLLTADAEFSSPLIVERPVHKLGIVVFGSDDGLCGAYNVNIFKLLLQQIEAYRTNFGADTDITIYPVGGKITKAVLKLTDKHLHVETVPGVDSKTTGNGVKDFMSVLQNKFLDGELDRVDILYMSFKSVSRQRPSCEQLIPVVSSTFSANGVSANCRPYIFEPDANTIFRTILPMFLMSVMQDVFTENRASEQAARVMAMQSANDNAKKLLEQLQLEYNKLRQQSITTELLDILGGQIR